MPDFGIENLAKYLHLAPQQVARLADRGKLPGARWPGSGVLPGPTSITGWRNGSAWPKRILSTSTTFSAAGRMNRRFAHRRDLPVEAVAVPLAARTKNSVITSMVKLAEVTGILWDAEKMTEAIRSREELYPTAMENGVALLHPRRPMTNILAQAVLALGVAPSGIPFGSDRGALTDVLLPDLLGGRPRAPANACPLKPHPRVARFSGFTPHRRRRSNGPSTAGFHRVRTEIRNRSRRTCRADFSPPRRTKVHPTTNQQATGELAPLIPRLKSFQSSLPLSAGSLSSKPSRMAS